MATEAAMMSIRIAADVDELKQKLAEGGNAIVGLQASVEKMQKSFSGEKLIQHAHNMVAAIKSIENAQKLTASEQARVNSVLEKAIDKYRALGQTAPPAMVAIANATKQVEQPTSRLNTFLSGLGTQIASTAAGFISAQAVIGGITTAFRTLTDFIGSSIESYAAAEAANKKLEVSLRSMGAAAPEVIEQYNEMGATFQQTTVYSDDLITEMQALLTTVGGVMPSQMEKALTAATNLAAGLGIDLEQATMLVAKGLQGNTTALGKYGIEIDKARVKTEGTTVVLEAINEQFGGQAAAQIDTYSGKLALMANTWDNVKEAVGRLIVSNPILEAGLNSIATALGKIAGSSEGAGTSLAQFYKQFPLGDRYTATAIYMLESYIDHLNEIARLHTQMPPPPDMLKAVGIPDFPTMSGFAQDYFNTTVEGWTKDEEAQKKAKTATDAYQKSVQSLFETYTGAKDIEAARVALDAINQAQRQGVEISEMSRQQQEAINATLLKAIDAYKRFGKEAPPALLATQQATQDLLLNTIALEQGLSFLPGTLLKSETAFHGVEDVAASAGIVVGDFGTMIGRDLGKEVDASTFSLNRWIATLKQLPPEPIPKPKFLDEWRTGITEIAASFGQLAQASGEGMEETARWIGVLVNSMDMASKAGERMQKGGLANLAAGALEAGAAFMAATGSGNKFKDTLGGLAVGAQVGAAFGPMGAAIGAAAGAIGGFVRSLFGMSQARKELIAANAEIEKLRNQAISTYGSLDRLVQIGRMLGKDVMAEWGHQGKEGLASFQAFLKGIEADMQRLNGVMQQYGITWQQLGAQAQTFTFGEMVAAAVADFELLNRVGVDTTVILTQMSGTFNTLIAEGLRAGQALPPELAKIAQEMNRLGLLTDDTKRAIMGLAKESTADWKAMEEAANKYGIQLSDLGNAFAQAKITDKANQIVKDFDMLVKAGADAGAVMGGMQDEIQGLLTEALKTGAALPASMKPMIAAMIEAGQLTDEAGVALTDLSQVPFAPPITAGVDDINTKLEELKGKYGETATVAAGEADKSAKAQEQVVEAVGKISNKLNDNKGDWDSWASHAVNKAREVKEAVDAVALGSSPGGIKEIPIQLSLARKATEQWADSATTQFSEVRRAIDAMPWSAFASSSTGGFHSRIRMRGAESSSFSVMPITGAVPAVPAVGGGGGGTVIVVLDGVEIARAVVPHLPGEVVRLVGVG